MIKAHLIRNEITSGYIRGVFVIGSAILYTIERAWLDNKRNESCIPAGEYECRFLPRSASGKYRNVYHLQNVHDRSGVLIHNGNLASHSKGCIIMGSRLGVIAGKAAVLNSRSAMNRLNKIAPDGLHLQIIGAQHVRNDT